MKNNLILGHILALFTAIVWGVTLISTKILLIDFKPVEILFFRFLIAIFIFYIIHPHKAPKTTKKQELTIMFAGLTGITLYYLLENTALIYTYASNVGVINCTAPLFTSILVFIFLRNNEKCDITFFIGFIVAIIGISIIAFNGSEINLNPLGDIIAVLGAITWAFYSILMKKITEYGISTVIITRKTFIYGILFMIPFLFLFGFHLDLSRFIKPANSCNLAFLGILASALCFLSWNKAIKILGAIKSSIYIYLIPVITVIISAIVLKEPITPLLITGTGLTLGGLLISKIKKN